MNIIQIPKNFNHLVKRKIAKCNTLVVSPIATAKMTFKGFHLNDVCLVTSVRAKSFQQVVRVVGFGYRTALYSEDVPIILVELSGEGGKIAPFLPQSLAKLHDMKSHEVKW